MELTIIFEILGFAAVGHILSEFFTHIGWTQKPWGCNLCLTTWISLIPFIVLYGWRGVLAAYIAGVVSEIIYRLFQRL